MSEKTVSFRAQLKGTISDFLKEEKMYCTNTEEGLVELIVALSNYTEEGHPLFPQVILCDNLNITLRVLQCREPIIIGSGPRDKTTMIEALKRCAPLAQHYWAIFLERTDACINYGVFMIPHSPTAIGIRDTIQELIGEQGSPHIIYATQIADKAVELVGTCTGILNIYLSATPTDDPSPRSIVDDLVISCCEEISAEKREQIQSFLKTTLSIGIHQSRGTLIAVLPKDGDPKGVTSDGVLLQSPISFSTIVSEYEMQPNGMNLATLSAYRNLIIGMLSCDGITFVNSQCELLGYNLFVTIQDLEIPKPPEIRPEGGARHRAYKTLKDLVDKKTIKACFIQSSDGRAEFYKG